MCMVMLDDETIKMNLNLSMNWMGEDFHRVFFLVFIFVRTTARFRNSVETEPNQTKCGMNENNNEL